MKEHNYEFLASALTRLGFPDTFLEPLREGMVKGEKEITMTGRISFDKEKNEVVEYKPEIKVSDKDPEMYFLNGFRATRTIDGEESRSHYFRAFTGKAFTAKNAREMLSPGATPGMGRAVYNYEKTPQQEGFRYSQLNFKVTNPKSGNYRQVNTPAEDFDLVKVLSKMPLGNLTELEKNQLLRDLRKGEVVFTTAKIDGVTTRVQLETLPTQGQVRLTTPDGQIKRLYGERTTAMEMMLVDKTPPVLDKARELITAGEQEKGKLDSKHKNTPARH